MRGQRQRQRRGVARRGGAVARAHVAGLVIVGIHAIDRSPAFAQEPLVQQRRQLGIGRGAETIARLEEPRHPRRGLGRGLEDPGRRGAFEAGVGRFGRDHRQHDRSGREIERAGQPLHRVGRHFANRERRRSRRRRRGRFDVFQRAPRSPRSTPARRPSHRQTSRARRTASRADRRRQSVPATRRIARRARFSVARASIDAGSATASATDVKNAGRWPE